MIPKGTVTDYLTCPKETVTVEFCAKQRKQVSLWENPLSTYSGFDLSII